jgi:BirA family transcriptional regulator, biotin operon repressor / biotin---[acetyl-CoA-carboxylase] ligase
MDRLEAKKIRVPGLEVRVLERCTSTNTLLREERAGERGAEPVLLAAELQTAGRGRHGRRWRAEPGSGATFSIRRPMRCAQRELAGLSVAVGIAAAHALRRLGARGVGVKWPNDLMINKRKLAGILIETRPEPRPGSKPARSGSTVIVGIGINCRRQPRLGTRLGRGVAALDEILVRPASRNEIISAVAREVLGALVAWERRLERPVERPLERAA